MVRYEAAMLADMRTNNKDVLKAIRDSKDLGDDTKAKLKSALDQFAKTFA